VPSGKGPTSLDAQIEKVGFLKQLGADRLGLRHLPLAGLAHFARRMMSRKAAALARIKDPHRTIEIACFLRLRLLQLTDASLTLLDHQIAAQWRGARERVAAVQASRLRRFHRLLGDLTALGDDEGLGAADLRSRLRDLIAPFEAERRSTRAAEIRQELGDKSQELARLLKTVRAAELAIRPTMRSQPPSRPSIRPRSDRAGRPSRIQEKRVRWSISMMTSGSCPRIPRRGFASRQPQLIVLDGHHAGFDRLSQGRKTRHQAGFQAVEIELRTGGQVERANEAGTRAPPQGCWDQLVLSGAVRRAVGDGN
jgi:hypothetical protein